MASTQTIPHTGSARRGVELFMIAFAIGVVVLAYCAVALSQENALGRDVGFYAAGMLALFGAAHLAVRRFAPYADPLLLPVVTLLNGLGLVLIHRLDLADETEARQAGESLPSPDAPLQLGWTAIGIVLFIGVLALLRSHTSLRRYTYTAGAVGIALLLLPLVPVIGANINGARIWVRVAGFSLQPGEIAKIALLIFIAGYLVAKRDVLALAARRVGGLDLPRGRDLGPVLLAWAASLAVLVFERDLGSSLLFFGLFVTLLYVATERTSWLFIGVLLFVSGATFAYLNFSHVQLRVSIWLDPFADPSGSGYQLVQSLFGLGTGGLLGTGLGQGRPEIVPYAKTDFILATIGEELGLVGVMAVLLLYGLIVERGLRAALSVRDSFGKLLATGLAVSLALQVFIVVGGVTRLVPLTGLTLPFLSYGGSSLIASYVVIALLVRVSDSSRKAGPGLAGPPMAPASPPREARDDGPTAQAMTEVVRR